MAGVSKTQRNAEARKGSNVTDQIKLVGGPGDGRTIRRQGYYVFVPEYVAPKRPASENDAFVLHPSGHPIFDDPDLNPSIIAHRYNGATGLYVGADSAT